MRLSCMAEHQKYFIRIRRKSIPEETQCYMRELKYSPRLGIYLTPTSYNMRVPDNNGRTPLNPRYIE